MEKKTEIKEKKDCQTCGGEGFWPAGGDFDKAQYIICQDCNKEKN